MKIEEKLTLSELSLRSFPCFHKITMVIKELGELLLVIEIKLQHTY